MSCEGHNPENSKLKAPKRNRYFYGKLLDEFHLRMETHYHNNKRWLLNRLSLGHGVMCGLKVTSSQDGKQLCVSSGMAIDAWGREIIVPESFCIDPWKDPDPACGTAEMLDRTKPVYLCLVYRECLTDPMPVLVTDCEAQAQMQCGTIVEGYKWILSNTAPESQWPNKPSEALCAALKGENAIDRLKALCVVFADEPCQPSENPPCVMLAQIQLNTDAKSIGSIDNCSVRPFAVSNETLFEMILCLAGGGTGVPGPKGDAGPQGPKGDTGDKGETGSGLESGLVQISALSWVHQNLKSSIKSFAKFSLRDHNNNKINFPIFPDNLPYSESGQEEVDAIVIGFSDNIKTRLFQSINIFPIFEVLVKIKAWGENAPAFDWAYLEGNIYPVTEFFTEPRNVGHITSATTTLNANNSLPSVGKGLAFVPWRGPIHGPINHGKMVAGPEVGPAPGPQPIDFFIFIRLRGDFVVDTAGRAIDAEFARGELPTGSRPNSSGYGVQGGTFESWFFLPRSLDTENQLSKDQDALAFISNATIIDLASMPEISLSDAAAIIAAREEKTDHRFSDVDELIGVGSVDKKIVKLLRKRFVQN